MFFGRRKHAAPALATPTSAATSSATPPASSAAVTAPVVPRLSDELIFSVVQQKLVDVFGEDGQWTVTRRSDDESDTIFQEVFVHSLATAVTAGVTAARASLQAEPASTGLAAPSASAMPDAGPMPNDGLVPNDGPLGLLRAPRIAQPAVELEGDDVENEPAALSWEPAPITRWADLKRPVTGPIALLDEEGKAA